MEDKSRDRRADKPAPPPPSETAEHVAGQALNGYPPDKDARENGSPAIEIEDLNSSNDD